MEVQLNPVPDLTETLQQVAVFAELPSEILQWLVEQGREIRIDPGDILRHEGDPADCVFVMLNGELRVYQDMADHELVLATYKTLDFFGELPTLTGKENFWASGRAISPCHIFELPNAAFWELLSRSPSVTRRVLSTMAQRMHDVQSLYKHNEKLAALGTLAAGLAHEMNNPAAAVLRCVQDLKQILPTLTAFGLNPPELMQNQMQALSALYQDATQRAVPTLDPLMQSDREEELAQWLEDNAVPDAWKLVPVLVSSGLDVDWLNHLVAQVSPTNLSAVLHWFTTALAGRDIVQGMQMGASRISELVTAIKDYSFMDQAPIQTLDIHQGLESTLTILSHRLKQGDITIQRNYDRGLPRIQAYGSELNQLWTYLIDNAIDALIEQPNPMIQLRTYREGNHLLVEITDSGPGIPIEIQPRIFEAFFTTKAVGKGTGLGLDMTYRIVRKHGGDIYFNSVPGSTRFYVRLPLLPLSNPAIQAPLTDSS
ncbi:MAG: ATP-binding protein [Cyanobacteria bacterium J06633_2]